MTSYKFGVISKLVGISFPSSGFGLVYAALGQTADPTGQNLTMSGDISKPLITAASAVPAFGTPFAGEVWSPGSINGTYSPPHVASLHYADNVILFPLKLFKNIINLTVTATPPAHSPAYSHLAIMTIKNLREVHMNPPVNGEDESLDFTAVAKDGGEAMDVIQVAFPNPIPPPKGLQLDFNTDEAAPSSAAIFTIDPKTGKITIIQ